MALGVSLKIVADEQIPYLNELFAERGLLIKKSTDDISPALLKDADLLLVRSVNKINQELLQNSSVKMVGSATAGFDHVDVKWLQQQSIHFAYSAGCNANAVAEYVVCCIAKLTQMKLLALGQHAGIIGLGHVGSLVHEKLLALNFSVLLNDPPLAQENPNFESAPLSKFYDLDLICVHPALTRGGPFPSYHLINQDFLRALKKTAIIINASRGEVLDESALFSRHSVNLCSDVWAQEPHINYELLARSIISTPHIAGYSLQAKYRASQQIYQAAKEFFSWPESDFSPKFQRQNLSGRTWEEVVLQILDPDKLKIEIGQFAQNRKAYPLRNEFEFCDVDQKSLEPNDQEILIKLGFNLC